MRRLGVAIGILCFVGFFGSPAFCQEKPDKVGLCDVAHDPAAYNHKLLEVTGLVEHGFEIFNLFDPTCSSSQSVWLEYGGKSKSGTTYCCGVTPDRHRSKELVVEGIPIPLVKDSLFFGIRQVDSTAVSVGQGWGHGTRDARGTILRRATDPSSKGDFLGRLWSFGLLQPVRDSTGQVREP